jgi:hypothetical protein
MTTADPYGFYDTRDNGSTRGSRTDVSARGRWMDDVRGENGGTELAPGIRGDGHQRVVRSQDGHIVIYNYGTINFNRKEACGGVDYRDGNRSQDFRDQIPYARDQQRPRNPQTFSVGDDNDDYSEAQFSRWQNAWMQRANYNNLAQRNFSERTYPQQLYGPQQPNFGPQAYYAQRPPFGYPPGYGGNGLERTLGAIGQIALPLAEIYALSRGRGNGLLALQLGNNGGNWNGNNWNGNNGSYWNGNNNGAYYNGGFVPGTFNQFSNGGTQYWPNNAYTWQNATAASLNYGRRPVYQPQYYVQSNPNYTNPGYVQGWDQNYDYS